MVSAGSMFQVIIVDNSSDGIPSNTNLLSTIQPTAANTANTQAVIKQLITFTFLFFFTCCFFRIGFVE